MEAAGRELPDLAIGRIDGCDSLDLCVSNSDNPGRRLYGRYGAGGMCGALHIEEAQELSVWSPLQSFGKTIQRCEKARRGI
jgi:hypothetical protein